MFCLKDDHVHLDPSKRIIKSGEYATWVEANEIIKQAKARAEEIETEAKAAYEEQKELGYKHGLDEGSLKVSELMIETVDKTVSNFESLENRLIEIVQSALKKILGEIDKDDMVKRVVRNALEAVRNQKKVTLMVSPSQGTIMREDLEKLMREFPSVSYIGVETDPRIEAGGCLLETDMGKVDASIEIQLKAIQNALTRSIK